MCTHDARLGCVSALQYVRGTLYSWESLGTVVTSVPAMPVLDDRWVWKIISKGKTEVPFCLPWIPHRAAWNCNWCFTVRSLQLRVRKCLNVMNATAEQNQTNVILAFVIYIWIFCFGESDDFWCLEGPMFVTRLTAPAEVGFFQQVYRSISITFTSAVNEIEYQWASESCSHLTCSAPPLPPSPWVVLHHHCS